MIVIIGSKISIGHVGDCRAILTSNTISRASTLSGPNAIQYLKCGGGHNKNSDVIILTKDHTCENRNEAKLIRERTNDPIPIRATVRSTSCAYGTRVAGSLIPTRAIGDEYLKHQRFSSVPFCEYVRNFFVFVLNFLLYSFLFLTF